MTEVLRVKRGGSNVERKTGSESSKVLFENHDTGRASNVGMDAYPVFVRLYMSLASW